MKTRPNEDRLPYPFPSTSFDAQRFEDQLRRLGERPSFHFPSNTFPTEFRRSSVMIAFWRDDREGPDLRVLLTRRALTLSGHPGQMSFPGGSLEGEENWVQAALRETEEEVGIPREEIEVLGRLDDAWSGAGHHLVPIVGWLQSEPRCVPNPDEVDEIHMPSIAQLMTPAAYGEDPQEIAGQTYTNPKLNWGTGELYGLSTNLLIEALLWAGGSDRPHGPIRLASLRGFLEMKRNGAFEKRD